MKQMMAPNAPTLKRTRFGDLDEHLFRQMGDPRVFLAKYRGEDVFCYPVFRDGTVCSRAVVTSADAVVEIIAYEPVVLWAPPDVELEKDDAETALKRSLWLMNRVFAVLYFVGGFGVLTAYGIMQSFTDPWREALKLFTRILQRTGAILWMSSLVD